jgi:uncharacterized membrane protein
MSAKIDPEQASQTSLESHFSSSLSPAVLASLLTLTPTLAEASSFGDSATAIPSALAAYGHYLGLVIVAACLTAERLLIKPNISADDETKLVIADSLYGISGVLILVSGYYRVTQFGKGWDFYQHEPIFWLKLVLFCVMGASSLFPTIKIIQRAIETKEFNDGKRSSGPPPLSEKLAARMVKVVNAELLALASIPLAATFMSRGVGYADWFPWEAGAGAVGLTVAGLSFKYVKEALTWNEDSVSNL